MDLKKITTKQLLQQLSAVGIEKPTQKDGLVALLQNHSRFTRHQQQAQDLAAIEQKIIEGPGKAELEMLLHRMMKILLTGLDLTLPQLPRGTEVQMQVSMNVTHTQIEIINADDQNRGGAPPLSEEDRNDMAMSNLAMVDEEEEEGKGLIEKLHPRPRARPENQEPEDRESNTSPIKRKRENSLASSSGSQQPILSKSKVESKAGFTSNEQTFEAFAPKSRSTLVKQPKKKQKRIGGRFVSGRE